MKVGILTFHRAINYGGVLQAFALQRVINMMGIECEVVDYYCPFIEEHYRPTKKFNVMQIKRYVSSLLFNGEVRRNIYGFGKFVKKYIKLSDKIYMKNNISEANEVYDVFITGSDQVWSPTCAGFDENYFLDFATSDKRKIAYAASFGGKDIPNKYVTDYRERISKIQNISVREKSGVKIVKQCCDVGAKVVLDPTLLVTHDEWNSIFNTQIEYKYVLVYMIDEDKDILLAAQKYAKKRNLKVVYINNRIYKARNCINIANASPDEWVAYFLNAEKIFTNSFHGIAFSINFNKDFFSYELKNNRNVNERLHNILSMFEIEDRLVVDNMDIEEFNEINYEKINELLLQLRINSLDFLKNALNADVIREIRSE